MALDKLTKVQSVGISSFIQVVGVVTATQGFDGNITGIVTATGDLTFGANSRAKLFENGTQSGVQATNSGSSAHLMTHDGNEDIHVDPSGYIKVEVAGSERLRITSDGKMGLGISSPARGGLHIHKAATAELHLTDDTTGSGSGDGFTLFSTSSSAGVWYRENAPLRFATYNTERVRISSGGNVGINETAPDRQLHVKSGANSNDGVIRIESANDNIMDVGTDGTGHFLNCVNTDPFRIKFAGTETVRIHSSGVAQFTTTGTQYVSASVPAFVVNSNGDHALVVNNQNTTDPRGLFIYQDQDVNNGTSYFWRARAGGTDRAHLYSNGTLQLHSGNLKLASGNGIDFSATSNSPGGSMSSELLDDYEEGTWTPDLQFGGAKVGITYNNRWGRYTKIGRQVTVIGRITLGSKGSSGGIARFFGLPYVTESITGTQMSIGSLWYSGFNLQGSIVQVVIRTDGNGNSFVEPKGVTANAEDAIGDSDFANNTDMVFTITYTTS